jgi:recombination protein RecA
MAEAIRQRARATGFTISKDSEIGKVMADVSKTYGPSVIRRGSVRPAFQHCPTDIFTLDMALFGGIPRGLCVEIHGWESGGKTTLAQRILARMQRLVPDMGAAYMDIEGTYDPAWGARHGVDNDAMVLAQPTSGEQACDIADALLRSKETSLVVVDSLPALVPIKEVDASVEDAQVALQARMISKFLRKAQQALLDERHRGHFPTLLLINQWRMKIGVMHGDPRTLPGGNALKFIKSVSFEVMNKEHMGKDARDNEVVDHNVHSFKIKKNKIGNGIRTGEFKMIRNPDHPRGPGFIDDGKAVITYASSFGLFTGGGGSWRFDGLDETFRTHDDAVEYCYDHAEFYTNFKNRLISMQREAMGLCPTNWL